MEELSIGSLVHTAPVTSYSGALCILTFIFISYRKILRVVNMISSFLALNPQNILAPEIYTTGTGCRIRISHRLLKSISWEILATTKLMATRIQLNHRATSQSTAPSSSPS